VLFELPLLTLGALDASGSRSTVGIRLRAGTTVAAGRAAADTFTSRVTGLSGTTIDRQFLVYRGAESPMPAAPGPTGLVNAGVFVFSTTTADHYAIVQLPALRPDLLLTTGAGAGLVIDQTAADVIAFTDAMVNGVFCDPFGNQIAALEAAFLQYRP
jgi:nucleoside phosphorylase